jgi:hypothetical protein
MWAMHALSIMARSLFVPVYVQFMDATLGISVINGKNLISLRTTVVHINILMICHILHKKTYHE